VSEADAIGLRASRAMIGASAKRRFQAMRLAIPPFDAAMDRAVAADFVGQI
jgi:hypothetical protein